MSETEHPTQEQTQEQTQSLVKPEEIISPDKVKHPKKLKLPKPETNQNMDVGDPDHDESSSSSLDSDLTGPYPSSDGQTRSLNSQTDSQPDSLVDGEGRYEHMLDQPIRTESSFGLSLAELERELAVDRKTSLVRNLTPSEVVDFYLEKTLSHSPSDVAQMMKFLYFRQIRFDGRFWYRFKVHKWKRLESNPLELLARNDMVNLYLDLANKYNRAVVKYTAESEKYMGLSPQEKPMYYPLVINDFIYKSKLCSELCLKLNNHSYHQKVISCGEQCFFDKDFTFRLDINPYALGFNNGNWDLRSKTLSLGTESNRISMSVGYDFLDSTRGPAEVQAFFEQLGLEDLIPILGSMLSGLRRQPVVWIKGLDRQGMEMLSRLLLMTLGDYLGSLPFWMLRKRKIKGSEPQMELVDNCRKRVCLVVQEEDDYPSVNAQIVDWLLCEDSFDLRKPREDHNTYIPQFGLMVLSTKKDCEPLQGCYLLEAKPVTGKIKVKDEWRIDLMKLMLGATETNQTK